jgi:hypothetical protein
VDRLMELLQTDGEWEYMSQVRKVNVHKVLKNVVKV